MFALRKVGDLGITFRITAHSGTCQGGQRLQTLLVQEGAHKFSELFSEESRESPRTEEEVRRAQSRACPRGSPQEQPGTLHLLAAPAASVLRRRTNGRLALAPETQTAALEWRDHCPNAPRRRETPPSRHSRSCASPDHPVLCGSSRHDRNLSPARNRTSPEVGPTRSSESDDADWP